MINPFEIVSNFEEALQEYTGAPHVVTVNSCTSALFLVCKYLKVETVYIPSQNYISPAMEIMHAGGTVVLDTSRNDWSGVYQLKPYPIYDSAKRFTENMYIPY